MQSKKIIKCEIKSLRKFLSVTRAKMCCRGSSDTSSIVYDVAMPRRSCKACLRPSTRLHDMSEFASGLNMSIKACFSMLTAIDVKESDKICRKCLRRLMKCSEFVEMCEHAERVRRQNDEGGPSETEIEEVIEGEAPPEDSKRGVKFEAAAPAVEETYESDFEALTTEDEGIDEDGSERKFDLRYYCTICRESLRCCLA